MKVDLSDYSVMKDSRFKVENDTNNRYIEVELCSSYNMTVVGMPDSDDKQQYADLDQAEDYAKMLLKAVSHARKLKESEE